MKAENERLRRDNERFVRLIDSGEWGRGRVAELTQAGECSMQPCLLVDPCFLVCQLNLCTQWMNCFCQAHVSIKALYTMDGLVLSVQQPMPPHWVRPWQECIFVPAITGMILKY